MGGVRAMSSAEGEYTTYSPVLSSVKELENMDLSCVALVGTPCQVRTIRKMQCLGVAPAHVVGYALGSFCMGHFAFDGQGQQTGSDRQRLEEKLGIDLADIEGLTVREDLNVSLSDGSTLRVPLDVVEELALPTCLACTEFASDFADLSIGGLGSPDGYSTVLIRTDKGSRVYRGALEQGYIEERTFGGPTESRSEKTRMLASVVACARRKRERGEARLKEIGLDAPSE
jgi:coenzyme F420 hydrogenase subunit beta